MEKANYKLYKIDQVVNAEWFQDNDYKKMIEDEIIREAANLIVDILQDGNMHAFKMCNFKPSPLFNIEESIYLARWSYTVTEKSLVHCKDCKLVGHCPLYAMTNDDSGFCSFGHAL